MNLLCWMWPLEATIKKTKENQKGIIIDMKRERERESRNINRQGFKNLMETKNNIERELL
jgi:hypothetical protein